MSVRFAPREIQLLHFIQEPLADTSFKYFNRTSSTITPLHHLNFSKLARGPGTETRRSLCRPLWPLLELPDTFPDEGRFQGAQREIRKTFPREISKTSPRKIRKTSPWLSPRPHMKTSPRDRYTSRNVHQLCSSMAWLCNSWLQKRNLVRNLMPRKFL